MDRVSQHHTRRSDLFAYQDFDGDFKSDGVNDKRIKTFSAHVRDWKEGDPTWKDGKAKGLIEALNYLASNASMNCLGK